MTEYYRLHVAVEQIRVPELLFQPSMIGMDQGGLSETLEFVLNKFPPHQLQRLVQVLPSMLLNSLILQVRFDLWFLERVRHGRMCIVSRPQRTSRARPPSNVSIQDELQRENINEPQCGRVARSKTICGKRRVQRLRSLTRRLRGEGQRLAKRKLCEQQIQTCNCARENSWLECKHWKRRNARHHRDWPGVIKHLHQTFYLRIW